MQTEIVQTTCWMSHGKEFINDVIHLAVKHANNKQQTARDVAYGWKTNLAGNLISLLKFPEIFYYCYW